MVCPHSICGPSSGFCACLSETLSGKDSEDDDGGDWVVGEGGGGEREKVE